MKAYAIFDLPDGIKKAEIAYDLYDSQTGVRLEAKACDLKPLPEKIWHEEGKENECEEWHKNGWNDCIDEILGETE